MPSILLHRAPSLTMHNDMPLADIRMIAPEGLSPSLYFITPRSHATDTAGTVLPSTLVVLTSSVSASSTFVFTYNFRPDEQPIYTLNYGSCIVVLLSNSHILLFDVYDIVRQSRSLSTSSSTVPRTVIGSVSPPGVITPSSSSSSSSSTYRSIVPFAQIITRITHPCYLLIDSTSSHWIEYWKKQCISTEKIPTGTVDTNHSSDATTNRSNANILDRLWIIGSTGDAAIIDIKDIQQDISSSSLAVEHSSSTSTVSPSLAISDSVPGLCIIRYPKYIQYWKYRGHSLTTNAVSVFPTIPRQPLFEDAYQIMQDYHQQYLRRQGINFPPTNSPSSSTSTSSLDSYLYTFGTGTLVSRYVIPDERGLCKEEESGLTDQVVKIASHLTSTAVNILRIVTKKGPLNRLSRWFGSNDDTNDDNDKDTNNSTNTIDTRTSTLSSAHVDPNELNVMRIRSIEKDHEFQDSNDRAVLHTLLDPTGQYIVCVTTHGRVLLIQAKDMSIVRLWKGYRQAQIGFIERYTPIASCTTPPDQPMKEIIPSLVIYTSVRGTIDIWPLNRNGARIATMKVTKNGYLCYQTVWSSIHGLGSSSTSTSLVSGTPLLNAQYPLVTLFISRERIRNLSSDESSYEEEKMDTEQTNGSNNPSSSTVWISELRCS